MKKIMMVGTDMDGKGGIASVLKGYCEAGFINAFNITFFPIHAGGSKSQKIVFFLKGFSNIILNIMQFQILHLHTASRWSFRRKVVIVMIAKLFSKKVIIHVHGAEFDSYFNGCSHFEKKIIKFGFDLSDRVISLSPQWSLSLQEFCDPDKIIIIPNCVKAVSKENVVEYNRKRLLCKNILFLGRLEVRKGIKDLLVSIRLLKSIKTKFKIFLCGDGDLFSVSEMIKDFQLQDVAVLVGWVDSDKKINYLKDTYLFVLPSFSEGLPMSILEAMSFGIPIISTDVGGIPYAIENLKEGILTQPGNPQIFAQNIQLLLENEELWYKMSLACNEKITKAFSSEYMHSKLDALYSNLNSDNPNVKTSLENYGPRKRNFFKALG